MRCHHHSDTPGSTHMHMYNPAVARRAWRAAIACALLCSLDLNEYLLPAARARASGVVAAPRRHESPAATPHVVRAPRELERRAAETLQVRAREWLANQTAHAPIGTWDTHTETDMSEIFEGAADFDEDIGQWNTARVTGMGQLYVVVAFPPAVCLESTALLDESFLLTPAHACAPSAACLRAGSQRPGLSTRTSGVGTLRGW